MKTNNRFMEIKIKMVMKLRGISREVAMRELHIDSAAVKKADDHSVTADPGFNQYSSVKFLGEDDPFKDVFKS